MLSMIDKLNALVANLPYANVRDAFIARARLESGRTENEAIHLDRLGFEQVAAPEDARVLTDGREVLRMGPRSYALRPEVHAERLRAALDAARERQSEPETKSVVGTESLSVMTCPKCGDALQHTAVCPSCASGKLGYRHRYACVCGGVDLISKDKL